MDIISTTTSTTKISRRTWRRTRRRSPGRPPSPPGNGRLPNSAYALKEWGYVSDEEDEKKKGESSSEANKPKTKTINTNYEVGEYDWDGLLAQLTTTTTASEPLDPVPLDPEPLDPVPHATPNPRDSTPPHPPKIDKGGRGQPILLYVVTGIFAAFFLLLLLGFIAYFVTRRRRRRGFKKKRRRKGKVRGLSPLDPSSYSRPEIAVVKHISLSLDVDFEQKVLSGSTVLTIDVLEETNEVILDASNLNIESIETEDGTPLHYDLGTDKPNYGSKLSVTLPKTASVSDIVKIKIRYATKPSASALQWLEPNQTSGKEHPYLFSQCQPIHARSIMPCQDTPAVKFTYDATVTAPEQFTVLMSALRGRQCKCARASFRQPVPIPSYLLAIAVGVLESRQLGPRSWVWSEKKEIARSAWEFAETEKYLQAAEKLCGQYAWTRYDLLVLPSSFPYGGMENPCLTFVTPTLLAGDRSQTDVIVHEIMHSWTGNLVTNRNFEHFWLNEGFTVFLERKVGASLIADPAEAKRSRDFHSLLGLQELSEAVNDHLDPSSPLTKLVVNLTSVHPDDAFSRVPYEKGSLFLRYLEDLAGGPEVFDAFLRSYLTHYKRKSLDTDQFKAYLLNYFKDNENLKNVDWDTWLNKSGMPPVIPYYDTSMTKAVTKVLSKIEQDATLSHEDVHMLTPHQMIHLLQELVERKPMTIDKLRILGRAYMVNSSTNSEIQYRWLRLCVRSKDEEKLPEVFNFVNNQGRMKYVRPIYRDLYAWKDVREQAIDNFHKNERYMMHVSAYTLRKDLHLSE